MVIIIDWLVLIIYILLIVLICVGIVLGIRLIVLVGRVQKTLDNIDEKVNSFNALVSIMNKVDVVKSTVSSFIVSTFRKRKEGKK